MTVSITYTHTEWRTKAHVQHTNHTQATAATFYPLPPTSHTKASRPPARIVLTNTLRINQQIFIKLGTLYMKPQENATPSHILMFVPQRTLKWRLRQLLSWELY